MEKRRFGSTDMHVSVLGFGGAEIGFEGAGQATTTKLLNAALDAGLNIIDTAECYIDSETLIGNAVAHRRDEFYLFTKCGHNAGFDEADWDIAMLEKSIDRSLRELKTDRVDLIQLHSCSEELLRRGEVIDVLTRARDAGKTRYVGYSGDGAAAEYAVATGAFDALQTSCNIMDQEAIDGAIPAAANRGMGIIAKRPIANAVWRHGMKPPNAYHHEYYERLQKLKYPFLTKTSGVATALRFTLMIAGVDVAIVGTTNPERWAANAALAAQGPLDAETYAAIRARWHAVAGSDWTGQT
jgi:aryl-alcohol dehydrogenase-like predicted oxidoreductase